MKFKLSPFLSILILLFLSVACGSFSPPATLIPTSTLTPTQTRTPYPTSTSTIIPTLVLTDISEIIIKDDDLPSNFYPEITSSGSTRTVKRYIFATIQKNQVIQGITFIISANSSQEELNSYFEDPKKLLDSAFGATAFPFANFTINPNADTYGERSATFSGNTFVDDLQIRGEFILFQKSDIAALISTYYPQGGSPNVTLGWLARLIEDRMNTVTQ